MFYLTFEIYLEFVMFHLPSLFRIFTFFEFASYEVFGFEPRVFLLGARVSNHVSF